MAAAASVMYQISPITEARAHEGDSQIHGEDWFVLQALEKRLIGLYLGLVFHYLCFTRTSSHRLTSKNFRNTPEPIVIRYEAFLVIQFAAAG